MKIDATDLQPGDLIEIPPNNILVIISVINIQTIVKISYFYRGGVNCEFIKERSPFEITR